MEIYNSEHESKQSRRKFIQQSAMAGAGITLINPLQLFAQGNNSEQMNKNIKSRGYAAKDASGKLNMKIFVGSKTFTATLTENEAATALKEMLPMTLNMSDLNGNEKYFRLSNSLPEKASNPGTIHAGDLMLWGSNMLVLFYETFSTSYSYTRIGRINDPTGLAQAVGSGSVMVRYEIE